MNLFTIGVYGFNSKTFFDALVDAEIDMVCDVRNRRGVRGSNYAFANSNRLQDKLSELGIGYVHHKELGPSRDLRSMQYTIDEHEGVKKDDRQCLSFLFLLLYTTKYLGEFCPSSFLESFKPAENIALMCVETNPMACHRFVIAERIVSTCQVNLSHIEPSMEG